MPFLSLLGGGNDPTAQAFSFTPADATGFQVLYTTVSDRGTIQTIYSTFTLHKEFAVIGVNAQTTYRFDAVNGWLADDTGFVSRIESITNLAGTRWVGEVQEGGYSQRYQQFILSIIEFNDDGTLRATFDIPSWLTSGVFTGFFDTNRLSVSFTFDEWTQPPLRQNTPPFIASILVRDKINLTGFLFVEDMLMRSETRVGGAHYHAFSVKFDSWFDVTAQYDDDPDDDDD
jgi:hypothetical protein